MRNHRGQARTKKNPRACQEGVRRHRPWGWVYSASGTPPPPAMDGGDAVKMALVSPSAMICRRSWLLRCGGEKARANAEGNSR